jgi:DNA polymerase-1
MTHLLIDADLLLYKAAIGAEYECDWGGDNWVLSANLQQAKDAVIGRIIGMNEHFNPSSLALVISGSNNFRSEIYPDYKSSRKASRKPLIYRPLREWLVEECAATFIDRLEADDTIGIMQTSGDYPDSIIVSEDKDMMTVPGKLYRGGELLTITPEQAVYHHMLQTLTGDATDGYPGCKGVGPVGAMKLLQGAPEGYWGVVLQAYEKAGLTEDDALLNARMAYILHAENYVDGEIKIWTPPLN